MRRKGSEIARAIIRDWKLEQEGKRKAKRNRLYYKIKKLKNNKENIKR